MPSRRVASGLRGPNCFRAGDNLFPIAPQPVNGSGPVLNVDAQRLGRSAAGGVCPSVAAPSQAAWEHPSLRPVPTVGVRRGAASLAEASALLSGIEDRFCQQLVMLRYTFLNSGNISGAFFMKSSWTCSSNVLRHAGSASSKKNFLSASSLVILRFTTKHRYSTVLKNVALQAFFWAWFQSANSPMYSRSRAGLLKLLAGFPRCLRRVCQHLLELGSKSARLAGFPP